MEVVAVENDGPGGGEAGVAPGRAELLAAVRRREAEQGRRRRRNRRN